MIVRSIGEKSKIRDEIKLMWIPGIIPVIIPAKQPSSMIKIISNMGVFKCCDFKKKNMGNYLYFLEVYM